MPVIYITTENKAFYLPSNVHDLNNNISDKQTVLKKKKKIKNIVHKKILRQISLNSLNYSS